VQTLVVGDILTAVGTFDFAATSARD